MIRRDETVADNSREGLLALERRLLTEGVAAYEELLHRDAIVIVPGSSLDKTRMHRGHRRYAAMGPVRHRSTVVFPHR